MNVKSKSDLKFKIVRLQHFSTKSSTKVNTTHFLQKRKAAPLGAHDFGRISTSFSHFDNQELNINENEKAKSCRLFKFN